MYYINEHFTMYRDGDQRHTKDSLILVKIALRYLGIPYSISRKNFTSRRYLL